MPLTSGARLGSYEILTPLGHGGMGEVYRARDLKLGREVAIKMLPAAFTKNPDRLARFEQEARLLASLNDPHIAAIYGIEETAQGPALVLELVEGETLADLIAKDSGLALNQALSVARQIAEAFEAAHSRGIVHRDLKPANVKITAGGVVKVLDFGLAKAIPSQIIEPNVSQFTTVVIEGTQAGMLLGTPAYMSPEQARGKPVDKRTDIWAFGCVLFEMLTGRQPFAGDTTTDTFAAILDRAPNWLALPASTPANIRRLIERCLEKDFAKRLRDIGDAKIEIDEALERVGQRSSPVIALGNRPLGRWVAGIALGAVVAGAAALVWRNSPSASTPPVQVTFSQLTSEAGVEWFPSLSPDGKWVAYAGEASGNRDVYLQSVSGKTPINLTADSPDDDDQPAFTPDGERLAFRSSRDGGGIFVMGRTGESVRRVTRAGFKPSWSPDGASLVYATQNVEINPQNTQGTSELWVVNVASGDQKPLNTGDGAMASWSPHGNRIAFMKRLGTTRQRDVWTISPQGTDSSPVTADVANDWSPAWSPDGKFIYFSSDRGGSMNLWRTAIEEKTGKVLGAPEAITTPAPFVAHATVSGDGSRIAYSAVAQTRNIQKLSIDPATGSPKREPTWVLTGSRLWANPDPSPDGQRVAFYSSAPEEHIYVARSDGTGLRQVTSDAAVIDRVPRWSPDGAWIAFFSNRNNAHYQLWKVRPDGSDLQQLTDAPDDVRYPIWAPDGRRMAVTVIGKTPDAGDVYIFDPSRPWKEQNPQRLPLLQTPRTLFFVNAWSPDGERLAGGAGAASSGIVTYALQSRTYDRLTDFGEYPVWLPDSRHLMFVSGGKDLFVADTASKSVRKVFSVTRDVIGPAQLSRDGREAYFSRRVTEADIWIATLGTR